jgi:DNA-binding YbaB/EbfC family protein
MGKGFAKRKKQARAMQEQFMKLQEEMKDINEEGSAGNGLVKISLNGDYEITNVKINPECVDPEDIEGLETLIKAAHKDACAKVKEKLPTPDLGAGMPDLSALGF